MANATYIQTNTTTRALSSGVVSAVRYELYENFNFGEKVIARYRNYGTPEQQTQSYQYYTDIADNGYGKVAQKIDYDGKWTKYEYDSDGRISRVITPFGDATITADESQCQVVTYDYTKLDTNESADASDTPRWRTKITRICGQETARAFRLFFSNHKLSITATKPNVAYTDVTNRVQTTYFANYYDQFCGETIERPTRIAYADGTTEENTYVDSAYYNTNPSQTVYTTQKTTVKTFQGHALSREVELKNHFGTIESYRRFDLTGDSELLAEGYDQAVDRYGRPLQKTTIDGNVTSYEYYTAQIQDGDYTSDIPFEHVRTTKPDGSIQLEAFDTWGNKIFSSYDGVTTFYHYDAYGNVIETRITGRNGGSLGTSSVYTDDDIKTSETDANGNITSYTSSQGWEAKTDALGNVFKKEFFLDGRLKCVKVNDVVKNYYTYEIIANEVVTTEYASASEWNKIVTSFDGNILQERYPDGYVKNYRYDSLGRQVAINDSCNNCERYIYSAVIGELVTQWQNGVRKDFASGTAVDGATGEIYAYRRTYGYYNNAPVLTYETRTHRNERKTRVFDAGRVTQSKREYLGNGVVRETQSENGVVTINTYRNARLLSTQNATVGLIAYAYDEFNRVIGGDYTEEAIAKTIRYTLDANGNILSITQTAGENSRSYSYVFDALNRVVQVTSPEDITTCNTYDAQGNIIAISGDTYPQGYTYDLQNRMLSITTYRESNVPDITTFSYDNRGRVCQKTYADGSTLVFAYRGDGTLRTSTNARGQTIRCTYDAFNRLSTMQAPEYYWEFTYDYRGLLLRASNGNYYQSFKYDAYGNLTNENFSDIDGDGINYTYDGFSRLHSYSFEHDTVNYTYANNTDALSSVSYDDWRFGYQRISGNSRLSQTTAKLKGKTIHTTTRTYNAFGELRAIDEYSYTLDLDGKRISAALPDGRTWRYEYDKPNQLISGKLGRDTTPLSNHAYTYDLIGNRVTATDNGITIQYVTNALNQYTAINNAVITYDADGDLLSEGQFTYGYDALNQLVTIEDESNKQVFSYDFIGRRIATKSYVKNDNEWTLINTTRYVYQGWNVIAEYVNGQKSKTYLWGEDLSGNKQGAGGIGGLLLERNESGDYLSIYDGNGNVIAYKDASGQTVATYTYDPFGNTLEHAGLDFTYKFSTKPRDDLSRLYYYGYRYYHSELERWITREPIGERQEHHLYRMVNNNPICNCDVLGLYDLRNVLPGAFDGPGAPNYYLPEYLPKTPRTIINSSIYTGAIKQDLAHEIDNEKENQKIIAKVKALQKCKKGCETVNASSKKENFPLVSFMYWNKNSPYWISTFPLGQVLVECTVTANCLCDCKSKQCKCITSLSCHYNDKFDFYVFIGTFDTLISFVGEWND